MTTNAVRTIDLILDEATTITARFKEQGRNAPKDPHAIARLVMLRQESGLGGVEFAKRTRTSPSSIYLWENGKTTSAKPWPALVTAIAKMQGAAMAASMNVGLDVAPAGPPNIIAPAPAPTKAQPSIVDTKIFADMPRVKVAEMAKAAFATPGVGVDHLAFTVEAWRHTKWTAEKFASIVGTEAKSLRRWNAGMDATGESWPGLIKAMEVRGLKPSTRSLSMEAKAQQAKSKKRRAAKVAPTATATKRLSIEVRKWQALDLTLHDDEVAAEKASHVRVVDMAVEQVEKLCSNMSLRDLAFSRLESDSILNLADAIRARNAFEASQPRA
jgi:DNA-binding transcriptional regulator YiaG